MKTKTVSIIVTVGIAFLIGYIQTFNHSNDNYVFLKGILHPRSRNWNFKFTGYPWHLYNGTISDYFEASYHFIIFMSGLCFKTTLIHNARNSNLSFEENGFMLVKTQQMTDPLNTKEYERHIVGVVKKLFPNAKAVRLIPKSTVYRGISQGEVPVQFVHADGVGSRQQMANSHIFMEDKEIHSLISANRTLWFLGIWTPIQMKTDVCKDSLALLDVASLSKEDATTTVDINATVMVEGRVRRVNTNSSLLVHNENQKWWYYPHMTNDEMIIWTNNRFDIHGYKPDARTFHVSFTPNDCHSEGERRKSVENRLFVQF
eukprot:460962_1